MNIEELKQKYSYDQLTAMMQQYLDVKFAHMDCLVLFRMGDFYELFYDDANSASGILGIALTKRGDVPMCGIPHHALDTYLPKLLESGHKIAICDQLETPEEAKKLRGYKAVVKRDVVRIITPGTILEEGLLSSSGHHYLASIALEKDKAAVCYVDLSTSTIAVTELLACDLISQIIKLAPKELLLTEALRTNEISRQLQMHLTYQVDSNFATTKCDKIITNFYNIPSIRAIGDLSNIQIQAIGVLLGYILLTQKQACSYLPLPQIVNYYKYLGIDAPTRKSLEIVAGSAGNKSGSLFDAIDYTVTKSGSRLLYQYLSEPLTDINEINLRQDITQFFLEQILLRNKIRESLKQTSDIARALSRLSMNRGSARDLLSIKYTLDAVLAIKESFLHIVGINEPIFLQAITDKLSRNAKLYDLIDSSIKEDAPNTLNDGGIIKPEYHPKVFELQDLIANSKIHIEKLRLSYQQKTQIDNLKISHNNLIGLFIEVSSKHVHKMNDPIFIHKQTTLNSSRYTTFELQKLESEIVNAKQLVIHLEKQLFDDIIKKVADNYFEYLINLADSLSALDVMCSFAHVAYEWNYTRPLISSSSEMIVRDGRHPVIEAAMRKNGGYFVQNDSYISEHERIMLITGPNMSGKSTFLRQNAIIVIMAQIGCFVPASYACIGLVDKIFSRIGSGDDLVRGQSTFMVEMLETASILTQATSSSLIILDEIGRGTSTYDGVAIAWSVLEYIHNYIGARCLFATHYHELTQLDQSLNSLKNYTVEIQEAGEQILFLHKIIAGCADKSYGIHVAQIAGLPATVIHRANEVLKNLEEV